MIKKLFLGMLAIGLLITSCNNDDDNTIPINQNLTLNLSGLEDLGSDFVYEGWIIVNSNPVSTGTFTVDGSGVLSATSFAVDQSQLDSATAFVLSIEPTNDTDPAPANTKILQGDFSGNSASVNTGIVGDFSNAAGSFFLRTPTDETGADNGNNENGIWFGTPGMPPTPNFVLPALPAGWAYEGWVVGDVGPITTGVFTAFNAVDSTNQFSGIENNVGPPVPGEDFFLNEPTGETFPLDVRNRTVVISIEPVPDNSPAPFVLKPLIGTAGTETAPITHPLGLNLNSLPIGTITR